MMQAIFAGLGPNKVTVPFQESTRFVQGNKAYVTSYPYSFPHPANVLESQSTSTMNHKKEPIRKTLISKEDSVMYHMMVYLSPMAALPSDKESTLKEFKEELVKNLTNEKQLYKAFGFSKKRSCTVEDLSNAIMGKSVEKSADAMTYLAKLSNARIIIVNIDALSRVDYAYGDDTTCIFFAYDDGEYNYIEHLKTLHECNVYIVKQSMAKLPPISALKLTEAKTIVKFLTGNSKTPSTKAAVIAEIDAALKKIEVI